MTPAGTVKLRYGLNFYSSIVLYFPIFFKANFLPESFPDQIKKEDG